MTGVVVGLALALLGPPKLPPLPGQRAMPAPPPPAAAAPPTHDGATQASPRRSVAAPAEGTGVSKRAEPSAGSREPPRGSGTGGRATTVSHAPGGSAANNSSGVRSQASAGRAGPTGGDPERALEAASADELAALHADAPSDPPTREPGPNRVAQPPGDRPQAPLRAAKPGTGAPVLVRSATVTPGEPLTTRRRPAPPLRSAAFVLGYRQFEIRDALARRQSWHFVTVEVTPLRRWVRLNLLTEVGFEGGEAARGGDRADFMLVQKAGLGVQYPHFVTPFVEFQGGAGVARVEIFDQNEFVFVYTLGLDVGAQWAVTSWMYIHAAVGWIRPVFRYSDRAIRYDRVAFKLGIGF